MGLTYRDYMYKSKIETKEWIENAIYDHDHKFLNAITNNSEWHVNKHTDMSESELLDRVLSKEKTASSGFTYDDTNPESEEDQLKYNLEDALITVSDKIADWRFGDKTPNRLKVTVVLDEDEPVGVGYVYDSRTHTVEKKSTNAISIVLQKSRTNEFGIDAITAYPELQPNIQNDMKLQFDKEKDGTSQRYVLPQPESIKIEPLHLEESTIERTKTYQNTTKKEAMDAIKRKCGAIAKFMDEDEKNEPQSDEPSY